MPRSTVSIGRMVMREDFEAAENDDRVLSISGQESIPRLTAAQIATRREDFLAMPGLFVPVVFSTKDYLNGFYIVESTSGTIVDWDDDLRILRWQCTLTRQGTESEVDMESRLSGSLTRVNNFTITGERVHAPAIGHNAYWSKSTVSSAVTRTGEDGAIKVYRGLTAGVSPRWAVSPQNYPAGRVRILVDGQERAGAALRCGPTAWELSNGLVRVRPGAALEISAFTGGSWKPKTWDVLNAAATLAPFDYATVLDNRYESATIRLTKSLATGRVFVDLTLRRGFRFVEIYVQAEFSATLKVVRASTEGGTNATAGAVVAVSNDADGNKYIVGSAKTFTADTVNGGLSVSSAVRLDAFVGVLAGGTGAVTGDQTADLQKQYIGAPAELVQAVRR